MVFIYELIYKAIKKELLRSH